MSGFRMVSILTFVLTTVLLLEECLGQGHQRRRQRNRNPSRGGEGLPSAIRQAYQQAVDGHDTTRNSWESLAPSTPANNAVQCFIEVLTVRQVGGRCTRLGGDRMPYICQSGAHFEFNPQCEHIFENSDEHVHD